MLKFNGVARTLFRVTRANLSPVIPFNLADVGEGIAECEVTQWHVAAGDSVQEFDAICEVQSDKATVEITSRYKGKITALHHEVGDMAKVGSPLIDIDVADADMPEDFGSADAHEADAEPDASPSAAAAPSSAATSSSASGSWAPRDLDAASSSSAAEVRAGSGPVLTTPAVRHIAKSAGVDLAQVTGTGKGGRVLKEDVLAFIESGGTAPSASQQQQQQQQQQRVSPQQFQQAGSAGQPGSFEAVAKAPAAVAPVPRGLAAAVNPPPALEDRAEKLTGVRRAMVKSMTAAAAVPHFGFADEFELSRCIALRRDLSPLFAARGVKLTYLPIFVKAFSAALLHYPALNASLTADDEVSLRGTHNIGIAMDTPKGLVVPNIKGVERLSLFGVAAEISRLQGLAMDGKLGPSELTGGTITISNIGNIGGTYLNPVLMPGEATIVALGRMQRLPRFEDGSDKVVEANVVNVSFSCDHRVLDGASVASFSALWKSYMENPSLLLSDLA